MSFATDIKEEINKLKMWDIKSSLEDKEQIERIHVREAFYKSGSITDPNKDYHLEIVFKAKKKSEEICQILEKNDITAKITKRRKGYILYIKDGEGISDFLAFIGTTSSVLRFEEIRVLKDMRNSINRKVNFETANLTKTVNASIEQINAINYIMKRGKFEKLDSGLKEVANIRLKNPEMSIQSIGELLENPISKSGVNHRLKKIIEIAEELKK